MENSFKITDGGVTAAKGFQAASAAAGIKYMELSYSKNTCDTFDFALAKKYGTTFFTSSAIRYVKAIRTVKEKKLTIRGMDCWTCFNYEPTHDKWYWYGIHCVDPLFGVMGRGCEKVMAFSGEDGEIAVGLWKDGRFGIARGFSTAKEGGLRGLILDSEDYYNERQYFLAPDEGDFETVAKLARRRGREVWEAVFRAFPEAVVLTYQFLSIDREYKVAVDPVCEMRIRGDLWPMYCNGILDALPPGAKIVDGDESGYRYEAAKGDFWRNASHQLTGVLPLVAPKNRAKYRAQVSVSFGMYPDSYAYHQPSSSWYFGPVAGSRLLHFEENLAQAVRAADEYVWFWGEHRTFVNWKDLDVRHWWDEWWPNSSSLDNALPGYSDMVRGVKDPIGYVKERLAAGGFGNLVSDESFWPWQAEEKDAPKGSFTRGPAQGRPDCRTMTGVRTGSCNFNIAAKRGEWYGVKVSAFGVLSNAATGWQKSGSWVKGVEGVKLVWDPPAADGWRTGWALVRVPDGVDRIVLGLYVHQQPGEQTHLDGVTVVRLRETPCGADERTEMPEHIRKRKEK